MKASERFLHTFHELKDKWLILPVSFGCLIEHARDEAERAFRDPAAEMGSISVKSA
jgi:hypothetical protein